MSEIVNVPMAQQRDLRTVTIEIRMITQRAQRLILESAIEIGRRLTEAKGMLPHGEWGRWLSEEVSFSQSTAGNLMRIYEEYAADQLTLDGAVSNSQTIGNLSYTKALKLLAIPAEEREDFVKEHHAEDLSVRELERLIRERDEKAKEAERLQKELKSTEEEAQAAIRDAEKSEQEAKAARAAAKTAEEAQNELAVRVSSLEASLQKATEAKKKATEKLKALQVNPEIPPEALERMQKQAQEEAEKAASEKLEQQLAANKEELERLTAEKEHLAQAAKAAEERRLEAEKRLQLASPEMVLFRQQFDAIQEAAAKLLSMQRKIAQTAPENGEKLKKALLALAEQIRKETEG